MNAAETHSLETDHAAFQEEIEAATYTDAHVAAFGELLERIGYTTTALAALAEAVREKLGDSAGSMMILGFAGEFARHEARSQMPE